ncbi:biotin/lipoyl-containing protein, partial [Symbiobacterium thermophilum]
MAYEFKLPDVGEGLHEAELLRWLVKEGDTVTEDQPIMEVQTDKATVEITSPVNGRVVKLLGQPGDILKVHSVVVIFDDGSPGALPTAGEVASGVAAAAPAGAQPQASLDVPAPAAQPAPAPAAPPAPAPAPAAGAGPADRPRRAL